MPYPPKGKTLLTGPFILSVNGNSIAVWERPGSEPAILFLHAAGFHSHCWNEVIARVPARRCICLDMRGHGRSSKPAPPYKWRDFGLDAADVASVLGLHRATGVGHSLGGHALALAAAINPGAFAEVILFDPAIFSDSAYTGLGPVLPAIARRRNRWQNWTDLFYQIKDRKPFDRWDRKVLLDYCEYGLDDSAIDDKYALACPPSVEASIYQNSTDHEANISSEIKTVRAQVTVVRSGSSSTQTGDFSASWTVSDLASRFPNAKDLYFSDYSHFLPMEAPWLAADLILK
jgi:pimeloyl-ACP methyl ester carboxylesterase